MSQEFQRIARELSALQEEILKNQLPSLLIAFLQSQDQHLQTAIDLFINNFITILRNEFIDTIATNIVQVKLQNSKLQIEIEQFKDVIKKESCEAELIKQAIKEISYQKTCLIAQLADLKQKQTSLSKLINSNSIQYKIKEILKQNEICKNQIDHLKNQLQVKSQQLNEFISKQQFYTSQISALSNDNNLFHQDLQKSFEKIRQLQECISGMKSQQKDKIQESALNQQKYKKQLKQTEEKLTEQTKAKGLLQKSNLQLRKQIQKINFDSQRISKKCQNIEEQNRYLHQSLQLLKDQISQSKQRSQLLQRELEQISQQKLMMSNKLDQQTSQKNQKIVETIQRYNLQLTRLQAQIQETRNQLEQAELKSKTDFEQFENYRVQAQQQIVVAKQQNQDKIRAIKQQAQLSYKQAQNQFDLKIQEYQRKIASIEGDLQKTACQLQFEKQQIQYYKLCMEENSQLKYELQRLSRRPQDPSQGRSQIGRNSKKFLFRMAQTQQVIQKLSKQNKEFKAVTAASLQTTKRWLMKQLNKFVCAVVQKKMECETCGHWAQFQKNKKQLSKKGGGHKSPGEIKSVRDLKALNEKYKLVKQQNELFGHRINRIIHN